MASNDTFRSFSYNVNEVVAKARWFKEDLEKASDWRVVSERPGSTFWFKTFPEQEIPIKILFRHDLPMSAEQFTDVFSPKNMNYRHKWDKAFLDNQILEEYPDNGGYIVSNRVKLPWPLTDRDFVLFFPPAKEIHWYGKRSFLVMCLDCPSKPLSGCIRATNGGNFYIAIPDEDHPEKACTVFGLTHDSYNGWLPRTYIEWLIARKVPPTFIALFDGMIEGCKMLSGELG